MDFVTLMPEFGVDCRADGEVRITRSAEITFVLPSDNLSGGVRVTATMADQLLCRGHKVRIAYPKSAAASLESARGLVERIWGWSWRKARQGWLRKFTRRIEMFRDLNELSFAKGEIVIAVGTFTVEIVRALRAPVIKVRYNHGFPYLMTEEAVAAWTGRMATIAVASTLVPRLETMTGQQVLGVVPNGINAEEYYVEHGLERNGIGGIYSSHPNKAPADLIKILRQAYERWPAVPQYVFSSERRPRELDHCQFTRYPSVDEARRIYNRARVWVVPSYTEGFGLPVLEAMACGCAVIGSDNDGCLELIRHQQNGIIVPRGDVAGFLTQIERVYGDAVLRERLVAEGQTTARRFTWEHAADKMESVLDQLANRAVVPTAAGLETRPDHL